MSGQTGAIFFGLNIPLLIPILMSTKPSLCCNYVRKYKSRNHSATHLKAVIIFYGCKFSLLAVMIAGYMHGQSTFLIYGSVLSGS
ncbi:hypothetical protein GE21DRAFT_1279685 [Neurospora crassa]|nr:hypothetical protein GE21DRAFT_1279685 [Neurospora crassa]